MPQGLQVWDAGGNVVLDSTKVVGLLFGSIAVAADQNSGSVVNEKFLNGRPFGLAVLETTPINFGDGTARSPSVCQISFTFNGNTMNWSRIGKPKNENAAPPGIIYYGAYSNA